MCDHIYSPNYDHRTRTTTSVKKTKTRTATSEINSDCSRPIFHRLYSFACADRHNPARRHQLRRQLSQGHRAATTPIARKSCSPAEARAAAVGGDSGSGFTAELAVLDEEQAAMMAEECILVDRNDVPTGSASKVTHPRTSRSLSLSVGFKNAFF